MNISDKFDVITSIHLYNFYEIYAYSLSNNRNHQDNILHMHLLYFYSP
jgi:hypothetical protein